MRIGVFTNNAAPNPGGVAVAVETLRRALRGRGVRSVLVGPRTAGHASAGVAVRRIPALSVNGTGLPMPGIGAALAGLARGLDVVHTQHPFGLGWTGAWLAARCGRPLVYSFHTRFEHYAHYVRLPPAWVRYWVSRRQRRIAGHARLALAPTRAAAKELSENGFRRVRVLPWPADDAFFASRGDGRLRGLTRARRVAVYAGRLGPEKRSGRLLDAMCRRLASDPAWSFVLAGDGPERPALERRAAASGLNGRIRFLGARPHEELPSLLASADVAVSASVSETQGLFLTEAQAAGLPVVTAPFPGAGEIVADGRSGIVAGESDPAFDAALARALGDVRLLARLSAGARRHARRFRVPQWAEALVDSYRQVTQGTRRRE